MIHECTYRRDMMEVLETLLKERREFIVRKEHGSTFGFIPIGSEGWKIVVADDVEIEVMCLRVNDRMGFGMPECYLEPYMTNTDLRVYVRYGDEIVTEDDAEDGER